MKSSINKSYILNLQTYQENALFSYKKYPILINNGI